MWFLIVQSSIENRREHMLKPGQNTIGRRAENDIVLQDPAASGWHADVFYDEAQDVVTIRDLDSTNGTFVNGKRIHDPCVLHHEDRVRVGICFLTLVSAETQTAGVPASRRAYTKVTSELILESVENYGALIHEIGQRLVNIPDLEHSLIEITELIRRMIGGEECEIVLPDQFDQLEARGIPASLVKATTTNLTARIVTTDDQDELAQQGLVLQGGSSIMLVPVLIENEVAALILSRKSSQSPNPFYDSDLQLTLAVSNQIAMSIQRHRMQGQLVHNSNHDALTDLPNRNLFLEKLAESIAKAREQKLIGFAVLFFDIDNFKLVNDSLGHIVGDQLLVAMAERLRHHVRTIDTIARASVVSRFGGDEFAILLDDIGDSRFALAAATRLKELLARPYHIGGKEIFTAVSIGVAMSTSGYERPEDILRDADIAMYRAKELGKERIEVYDKAMHAKVLRRMQIGNALRQGVLQKEFRLHYQPIVSLRDGRIAGHEALLRWYTPSGDILQPIDFLEAIDTAGLLYTTDHWVMENACRQEREWNAEFSGELPLFISVNVSPKYFRHPNLINDIETVLRASPLPPDRLWLEITEKVSAADDESAIIILKNLHSLGIRISLDDFGTGYSALNYLARFPIDSLKIDRSFIRMIGVQEGSMKIVEMIKALADHLGLAVVGEGIETAEQLDFLRSIDCEYGQGFYFAEPSDVPTAAGLLAEDRRW
ncbi:MAG TPA: EAL domain-containing protein [Anaerolineales bacterium]